MFTLARRPPTPTCAHSFLSFLNSLILISLPFIRPLRISHVVVTLLCSSLHNSFRLFLRSVPQFYPPLSLRVPCPFMGRVLRQINTGTVSLDLRWNGVQSVLFDRLILSKCFWEKKGTFLINHMLIKWQLENSMMRQRAKLSDPLSFTATSSYI